MEDDKLLWVYKDSRMHADDIYAGICIPLSLLLVSPSRVGSRGGPELHIIPLGVT